MKLWTLLILVILATSCGTRKRTVELAKLQLQIEQLKTIQVQNDIKANIKTTKQAAVTIFEPIDPDKESSFNGQTFKNAKVTIDTSVTDTNTVTTDSSVISISEENRVGVESKNKNTDVKTKKPNPYLWAGLALCLLLIIYLAYKSFNNR